ncbi:HAMP domain-containing sensor histidine kinase [Paenibacillus sp. 19GGS1-52]|uniref:sensor histidine kinase n=1 Tax=Paenibacillus sp. 19GGS1-52 TaxID=2758563 RepID=UPI001EFB9AD7|nr:HAMP domain-containing sensor histidine kinase [Paenibacillus sp. 19GGS1-52]
MDTKLKKNKSKQRLPIDLITILVMTFLFFCVVFVCYYFFWNFYIYIEQNFLVILSFFVSSVICVIVGRALFHLNFTPKQREVWHGSVLIYYFYLWQGGIKDKKITLTILIIFVLTATAGICGWRAVTNSNRSEVAWLILYEVLYILLVVPYTISRFRQFMSIINATREIAEGNIQYTIQETGSGALSRLAGYINNMKLGYQNALVSQVKSERLKTELITNVSHDLKTPLTSIINYVDLLKKEVLHSEKGQSYVLVLERKALRLKYLIEDLFEVSKMTSGTVELDIQTIDVATLLTQAIAEFSFNVGDASLEVREKIAKSPIYANLDGNKIWRVFENLIGNAKKYSLPGTRIYIYLDESTDNIIFKIQNTSVYEIDFAAEELFQRFKRADESRQTEGSGLGLAICKSIIELHGGDIKIEIHGDQFNVLLNLPKQNLV